MEAYHLGRDDDEVVRLDLAGSGFLRAQGGSVAGLRSLAQAIPAPLLMEGLPFQLRVPEVRCTGGKLASQRGHAGRANHAEILAGP